MRKHEGLRLRVSNFAPAAGVGGNIGPAGRENPFHSCPTYNHIYFQRSRWVPTRLFLTEYEVVDALPFLPWHATSPPAMSCSRTRSVDTKDLLHRRELICLRKQNGGI